MADKKISALTAATTPLAGTEVLPVVQSGSTVKVAVSDLTAARAVHGASFTASTGNFIIGTAGKGIDFSANSHAAGMTSEVLTWYEEGDWTPTFYGWTGTYTTQIGKYTRIGRQLFLVAVIVTNGGTGTFSQTFPNVQGLPFAIQYLGAGAAYGQWFGVSGFSVGATNTSSGTFDYGSSNEFFCNITGIDTAGVGNLTNGMLSNASNVAMRIIATYII